MSHLKRATQFLAAVSFAGFLAASAAQAAVINGNFDVEVPSNGTGGGWTSSNIDSQGGWRSTGGNPDAFFILNDAGSGTDPTILQMLTGLTPGAEYHVSGDFRVVHNAQSTTTTQAFGAAINGVFLFERPGFADFTWRDIDFDFTAAASSAILSFAAERNGTDVDFGIDNIALALVSAPPPVDGVVPEPGTAALLVLGLVAMMRARLRPAK